MSKPTGMLAYIVAGREIRFKTVHGKCLMLYYCSNVNKEGKFFKSMLDICAETTLSEKTVRRLNSAMKSMGVLSWTEGTNGKANDYQLNLSKMEHFVAITAKDRIATKDKQRHQWAERSRRYRDRLAATRHAKGDRDGSE